jgi:uncharacterized protein (DUF433 family)
MKIDRANDIAYAGMDPRDVPAYSIAEAARYLGVAVSTLRRWVVSGRLTKLADPERCFLSFRNLVEAQALDTGRRRQPGRVSDRVMRDESGAPVAVVPTMPSRPGAARLVVIDPFMGFGRPTIAGTGICTAVVAARRRAGESLWHLAEEYGRPVAEIRAAVRYERRCKRFAAFVSGRKIETSARSIRP